MANQDEASHASTVRELLDYDPDGSMPRMTAWEVEFVEGLPMSRELSDKQDDKLTEIWSRIFE